jgi:hypothetical protein
MLLVAIEASGSDEVPGLVAMIVHEFSCNTIAYINDR